MTKRRDWTEQELLLAFGLYTQLHFGQLHQRNPEVIRIAATIDRTPSAVSMKACNFASLDPTHAKRGVSGLGNASAADRALWARYEDNPDSLFSEVAPLWNSVFPEDETTEPESTEFPAADDFPRPSGPSDVAATVKVRRLQGFFRKAVLSAYGNQCALSDVALPGLLIASHIIPWAEAKNHRLDPRNGIALNALYDRAFDRGFFTLDEDYRVVVSQDLPDDLPLFQIQGKQLRLPERSAPNPDFIANHRKRWFG